MSKKIIENLGRITRIWTWDKKGNAIRCELSTDHSWEKTFNHKNKILSYKNSANRWEKYEYAEDGITEVLFYSSYDDFRINGKKATKEEFDAIKRDMEQPVNYDLIEAKVARLEDEMINEHLEKEGQ